ncbi:hypothetical protein GCM10018966_076410 [Streptomyces yanii]
MPLSNTKQRKDRWGGTAAGRYPVRRRGRRRGQARHPPLPRQRAPGRRGSRCGEFFGAPSAGHTATLTGTTVYVVRDGKIVELWAGISIPQFLQQLAGTA